MHTPSPELLRALRLAVLPFRTSNHRVCVAATARHTSRTTLSTRSLATKTTSSRLYARQPSSTPPRQSSPSSSPPAAAARPNAHNVRAPRSHDRGPASQEETQTDFSKMDILTNAGAAVPATSIDACTHDGFYLNNGTHTAGGMGVLLLDGEAFTWTPWFANTASVAASTGAGGAGFAALLDKRGILTIPVPSLGILGLIYPKPDLLIIGTGRKLWMLNQDTRKHLSEGLGIKVDVMDTANAAAAYNLLATERGTAEVGALMIPDGFRGL
ncbi:NADH dehydrogenase 1 alpha subcomplex assembly factor 3 [Exophiala viscosa]|uniref:NADH dehydrogenase 1 alpha subcomplex assembly factor 3 n=1 Tax=Exophiala viscosa TaxID=2486360 RepID=A0AAN6DN02_9EURO|nr:NADH dehydrogenase 1 alpha subcomplex assembly factor 3 [Exophiala viscosa]